jgi:hypothetical protein
MDRLSRQLLHSPLQHGVSFVATTPSDHSFDAERAEREDPEGGENSGFHENSNQCWEHNEPMEDNGVCRPTEEVVCWHGGPYNAARSEK